MYLLYGIKYRYIGITTHLLHIKQINIAFYFHLNSLFFFLNLGVLIHKLNWIADSLMKSGSMHHSMIDNFKNEKSNQLVCSTKKYISQPY